MTLRILTVFALLAVLAAVSPAADKSPQISDDVLYDMVKRKLANDPVIKGGALTVEVKEAVVTLNGQVETAKQKERATKAVKKVKGVRSVNNQLKVTGKAQR